MASSESDKSTVWMSATSGSRDSASVQGDNIDNNSKDVEAQSEEAISVLHEDGDRLLQSHLALLKRLPEKHELGEILAAPLFTYPILKHARSLVTGSSQGPFTQYALFAGDAENLQRPSKRDPRIFYNVSTPSSAFICGSQGSGKSHTLSCVLESCLIPSERLGDLPRPLTGIVFHYDTFISESRGAPCEAAYLASDPRVKVRVLCPPSNISTLKAAYSTLTNVEVEALRLDESNLNTNRMLELMAFRDGNQPLYMHVVQRILRDMRIVQQTTGTGFRYSEFKRLLSLEPLMPDQKRPLQQRLETLESFMVQDQVDQLKPGAATSVKQEKASKKNKKGKLASTDWTPKSGELIIVDMSCPCVTASMACSLFNICLSIFLEQDSSIGRIVALDEAHKYMGDTAECELLTNNLLSAIRLQRHLGARIVISTQEPTISPKLLDLCSVTIVHRFTSPDWLSILTKHLAGISSVSKAARKLENTDPTFEESADTSNNIGLAGISVSSGDPILELFSRILKLRTGEALVFAPSAIVGLERQKRAGSGEAQITHKRLAHNVLHVVVRSRITADGGQSILAA